MWEKIFVVIRFRKKYMKNYKIRTLIQFNYINYN